MIVKAEHGVIGIDPVELAEYEWHGEKKLTYRLAGSDTRTTLTFANADQEREAETQFRALFTPEPPKPNSNLGAVVAGVMVGAILTAIIALLLHDKRVSNIYESLGGPFGGYFIVPPAPPVAYDPSYTPKV